MLRLVSLYVCKYSFDKLNIFETIEFYVTVTSIHALVYFDLVSYYLV